MADGAPIFSDLNGYISRVAQLARLDAALLSTETRANLESIAIILGLFATAAVLASFGIGVLLAAIVLVLIQLGLAPSFAALIVAVALFAIAAALVFSALGRLKTWTLTPRRTLAQFARNLHALRESLHNETVG